MIVNVTQCRFVMPLDSYQRPQTTFPLQPDTYAPELHPASTINVESNRFQIGSLRNLAAVVKQNF